MAEYLKWSKSYGPQFEGLEPATDPFNQKWQEIAKSDPNFALDQRNFIKETHYEPQLDKLKDKGIDLSNRGIAVQEALWSTSVQYRWLTQDIFKKALSEKLGEHDTHSRTFKDHLEKMSDKNIVSTVQDYKSAHIHENFKSSKPAEQHRLHQRIPKEKDDLVALAEGRTPNYKDLSHLLPINVASSERMQAPHKLQSESQQLHETAHSAAIIPAFTMPEKLHKATPKDVVPVIHEQVHEHQAAHRASSPLLKEGSHGNEVMEAQKKLNALHYKGPNGTDLAADKIFDRATEFAVRNFQKENGLIADGLT